MSTPSPPDNTRTPDAWPNEVPPTIPDHDVFPRIVGGGSYGRVYLARNRATKTWRAVKVVRRDLFDSDRPFEREFEGILRFEPISRSHPSQVNILHVGRDDRQREFFYVMELADPVDGSSEIDPATYTPRTLSADLTGPRHPGYEECVRVGLSLAAALDHLHQQGLVHRDIKPANIIFVRGLPKLADIGLVAEANSPATMVGSLGFIAPEGAGKPAADLYSLGKVLYEMSTGRDRMDFPRLQDNFGGHIEHDQLRELNAIWMKACEPDPKCRHSSVAELHAELSLLRAGQSIQRQRTLEKRFRWMKRMALAALVLGVIGVGSGWVAQQVRVARVQTREVQRLTEVGHFRTLRDSPRQQGWRREAAVSLKNAASIRLDDDLRAEAITLLGGMDAEATRVFTNFGAGVLAFDPSGHRLLIGGEDGQNVRLWDSKESSLTTYLGDDIGALAFDNQGKPLQFGHFRNANFALMNPADRVPRRIFALPAELTVPNLQSATTLMASNGVYVAIAASTGVSRGGAAVWDGFSGRQLGFLKGEFTTAEFAPDASILVTGDDKGRIQLWSLPGLLELGASDAVGSAVLSLAIRSSPYVGRSNESFGAWLIAAGGVGGNLFVWDTRTRKVLAEFRGSIHDVLCTAFSPDGMTLASGGRSEVRLWDIASGRSLLALREAGAVRFDFASAMAFSPDGSRFVVGTRRDVDLWWSLARTNGGPQAVTPPGLGPTEMVSFWTLESERGLRSLRGLKARVNQVTFSPDSSWLAALSHDWKVGIWNLTKGRLEWVFDVPPGLTTDDGAMAFSRDGRQLAVAAGKGAKLWDLVSGREVKSWTLPWGVSDQLRFDSGSRLLLFRMESLPGTNWNGYTAIRNLFGSEPGKPLVYSTNLADRIFASGFSGDGDHLVVNGGTWVTNLLVRNVAILETRNGRRLSLPEPKTMGTDSIVAFDPRGDFLALSSRNGRGSSLYRIRDGVLIRDLRGPIAALGPEGRCHVMVPAGRGLRFVRGASPEVEFTLGIDTEPSSRPEFAPDGRSLAWGTTDGVVIVADLPRIERELEALRRR